MNKRKLSPSEAIYGFCGWLTTREEKTVMSSKNNCVPIADRIDEFCKHNGLEEPRPKWEKSFEHPN